MNLIDQIVQTIDAAHQAWFLSEERKGTPEAERALARKRFQALSVLNLLGRRDEPVVRVSPQGMTTQVVAEAVGAAALALLAQHGAEGVVLEVRLVRREGVCTPCPTYQEPEHGARCRACGGSRVEHDGRKDGGA